MQVRKWNHFLMFDHWKSWVCFCLFFWYPVFRWCVLPLFTLNFSSQWEQVTMSFWHSKYSFGWTYLMWVDKRPALHSNSQSLHLTLIKSSDSKRFPHFSTNFLVFLALFSRIFCLGFFLCSQRWKVRELLWINPLPQSEHIWINSPATSWYLFKVIY